ncbi:M42 family metallopeptidase [Clostridium senegalense]|uniref:M42 family metallopeptidase n=1 Tax=Clostridium senegalense TaxID=1465809 RepID=A0A6M0H196_9CLOT|nr:M42 family metallopeptidase [Clostridium senegalense]NEU04535.1 M42 family metallopeptidase [Clostridium senegalense]
MNEKELLKNLCESHGPSGREHWLFDTIKCAFENYGEVTKDNLNNVIIKKKGKGKGKIMLMAHADEIFMVVTKIDKNGFLQFEENGFDPKVLVSQEVIIHGKEKILGIIGVKPPHLFNDEDRKKAIKVEDLRIDTGYSEELLREKISVGDFVTIKRNFIELLNDNVSGKALDDRACIGILYSCAKELENINHDLDVYFVCSSQEEVGHRGAKTATYGIKPDIGIAIDVGFDNSFLGDEDSNTALGDGPMISVGPNIHPKLRRYTIDIAKEYNIPYGVEVCPGATGTDAWDIQISADGVPTLLFSLAQRYMHTSVEVVNINDIKNAGRLLAKVIEKTKYEDLEGILCF